MIMVTAPSKRSEILKDLVQLPDAETVSEVVGIEKPVRSLAVIVIVAPASPVPDTVKALAVELLMIDPLAGEETIRSEDVSTIIEKGAVEKLFSNKSVAVACNTFVGPSGNPARF